ncbi:hypothetical protein HEM09_023590, partial [Escherichia coli]|nr:hypothetical protein [Escherichia coli]
KKLIDLVKNVYANLDEIKINIDKLLTYCNDNPSPKNKSYYFNFISHLAETDCRKVDDNPLVISYRQPYKTAKVGGRSFENGTGFQGLPKGMKWGCLEEGYNYDIKSCQLEILRDELTKIGVSDENLHILETKYIAKVLKISEGLVKQFRYSAVFSAGHVNLSRKSKTVQLLYKSYGEIKTRRILLRWRTLLEPLKYDLNELIDYYLSTGKTNRYGLCVRNAVGQIFNCTYKDPAAKIRWRSDVMRRKLLAHMLQGEESRAVYDFVAAHSGICALEHDGFVSRRKLKKGDWKHPYLKLVMK